MAPYLKIDNQYARTIVCGDVHGCFSELQDLLDRVAFGSGDLLVCVGDMVDRGPESWRVAEFFRDTPNVYSALGNHERRIAGTIRGTSQPAWSQLQSLSAVDQHQWPAWADYFENLSAVIETCHAIVTHARLDPAVPLAGQDSFFTCAVGGPSVVIECDEQGVPRWFNEMSFEKPVCMGHIGYERAELVPRKLYALDAHAVHGGEFLAVVFPQHELISVKARRNYYSEARDAWAKQDALGNKWLDEWRMQTQLPKGDPHGWPLRKLVALLQIDQPIENRVVAEAHRQAEQTVNDLQLAESIGKANDLLLARFGSIPAAGQERGNYFIQLRKSFSDRGLGSLAIAVLQAPNDVMSVITTAFRKKANLKEAGKTLEKLVQTLE